MNTHVVASSRTAVGFRGGPAGVLLLAQLDLQSVGSSAAEAFRLRAHEPGLVLLDVGLERALARRESRQTTWHFDRRSAAGSLRGSSSTPDSSFKSKPHFTTQSTLLRRQGAPFDFNMSSWLLQWKKAKAALEPRLWTVPPEQHLRQLTLHVGFAAFWTALSAPGVGGRSSDVVDGLTTSELCIGVVMVALIFVNIVKKCIHGPMPGELLDMLLPCHVYNALAAYAFLGTSVCARETASNLLAYCAWMPLLAVAFPDTASVKRLKSPVFRSFSIALFFVHHFALAAVPAFLGRSVALGRHRVPALGVGSFAQYVAFANAYIGVALCVLAVVTSRNLNYSLFPPPLPDSVHKKLGGVYYRVTVGLTLSFVCGPLMRLVFYPVSAALFWLVEGVAGRIWGVF